jgi:hypothetical protein
MNKNNLKIIPVHLSKNKNLLKIKCTANFSLPIAATINKSIAATGNKLKFVVLFDV